MAAALLAGGVVAWATGPADPGPATGRDVASGPATGTGVMPSTPETRDGQSSGEAPGRSAPSATPGQPVRPTARDARPGAAPSRTFPAPSLFAIDSLGISMPIRPVGVAGDGQMALPHSPALMGWYEHGPRPGDAEGATVLAAHRDMPDYGTGPAARLDRLRTGEVITVRSGTTVRRYRVSQVTQLTKTALDLEAIFARTGPARLHVVTCSGRFDRETRTYEENLVVVAIPIT
jgi:LPXTG-site transpeptidase (sortase) family protein